MKNIKNNLPKSWCVLGDGSSRFKNTVIKYLNSIDDGGSDKWSGDFHNYYGIDKNGRQDTVFKTSSLEDFDVILTIDKFIELSKPINNETKSMKTLEQLEKQKAEIEKQIQDLKTPKPQVGKWYNVFRDSEKIFLVFITKIETEKYYGYGFINDSWEPDGKYYWFSEYQLTDKMLSFKEATSKQIESALIKEAKQRGFVLNISKSFISKFDDKGKIRPLLPFYNTAKSLTWEYEYEEGEDGVQGLRSYDGIATDGGGCSNPLIFKDGEWCKIVDSTPTIKIGEYEVKKSGSNIKIGCKTIPMSTVEAIYKMMDKCGWYEMKIEEHKLNINHLQDIINMK